MKEGSGKRARKRKLGDMAERLVKSGEGLLLGQRRLQKAESVCFGSVRTAGEESGCRLALLFLKFQGTDTERVCLGAWEFGVTAVQSVCACFSDHQKAGNLLR